MWSNENLLMIVKFFMAGFVGSLIGGWCQRLSTKSLAPSQRFYEELLKKRIAHLEADNDALRKQLYVAPAPNTN